MDPKAIPATQASSYAARLAGAEAAWWRRFIDVQAPYRLHLQRLNLGFTLDIGCGIGRNLGHLNNHGVGVDHNPTSVAIARSRGLSAFTPEEFRAHKLHSTRAFDTLLLAHVVEHMTLDEAADLLRSYLGELKPLGRVVLITPQEYGFASDPTHVTFMGFAELKTLLERCDLAVSSSYSFPLPRTCGRIFKHNEFVYIGTNRLP